jgi:hypothetical protein
MESKFTLALVWKASFKELSLRSMILDEEILLMDVSGGSL